MQLFELYSISFLCKYFLPFVFEIISAATYRPVIATFRESQNHHIVLNFPAADTHFLQKKSHFFHLVLIIKPPTCKRVNHCKLIGFFHALLFC